VLPRRI